MDSCEEMPDSSNQNPWGSIFNFGSHSTKEMPEEYRSPPGAIWNEANQHPYLSQVPATFSFGYSQSSSNANTHWYSKQVLGKRKNVDPLPTHINKQHITEAKMAEYMSNLRISSEAAPSRLEPESVKNKRLYMCEEMRKLQTESIIQSCLISQIEKPCTALVVWQPPERILPIIGEQSNNNSQTNKNNNNNNNNDNNNEEEEDAEIIKYFPEGFERIDSDATCTMDLDS